MQLEGGGTVTIVGNTITPAASDDDAIWVTGVGYSALPSGATLSVENNVQEGSELDSIKPLVEVNNRSNGGNVHWMTSITAAFESDQSPIADGAVVRLNTGTYLDHDVVVDKSVTIVGAGMEKTVVDAQNSTLSGHQHAFIVQADNVTIRDLTMTDGHDTLRIGENAAVEHFTLRNTKVNDSNIGIYVAGNDVDSGNGEFDHVRFENTHWIDNRRKAIYMEKLSNATFDELYIDGITGPDYGFVNGIDINLKGGNYTNITIRNSVVKNVAKGSPFNGVASFSAAIAIKGRDDSSYSGNPGFLDGLTIQNVTVADSFNGLRLGEPTKRISTPENVTVTGSTFRNNTGYHFTDVTSTPLDAGSLIENNTFDKGAFVVTNSTIWSGVQSAVDEAGSGDTVVVLSGKYTGVTAKGNNERAVEVTTDNLTIVGVGATRPVLKADGNVRDGILIVGADNVTIENFVVTGYGSGINLAYTENLVDESVPDLGIENLTLANVKVTNSGDHGIKALRGPTHRNITFIGVDASGNDGSSVSRGAYLKAQMHDVVVVDSVFLNNRGGGIDFNYVRGENRRILVRNVTTAGNGVGLAGYWVTDFRLDNSTIRDGIDLGGFQDAVITDNRFVDISSPAINLKWEFESLGVQEPKNVSIVDNEFSDIDGDGVVVGLHNSTPGDYVDVHRNSFVRVTGFRVNNTLSGMTVNATHNYWGGGGPGDLANVIVEPFYLDPQFKVLSTAFSRDEVVDKGDTKTADVAVQETGTSVHLTLPGNSAATSVSVAESEGPSEGAPNVTEDDDAVYMDISADQDVTGPVEISVEISVSRLDSKGISDPQNAQLFHYDGSAWVGLDTDVSVSNGIATLTATADGLSPFAIVEQEQTDEDDTGGARDDDTAGNLGSGANTAEPSPTPTPTASPGPTPSPSPSPGPTESAGTVSPTTAAPATAVIEVEQTDPGSPTATPGTTESPPLDGFGPLVTLLAVVALAGLAVRRSRHGP